MMSSISAGAGTVRGVELQKGSGSRSVELGSIFSLVAKSGVVDEDAAMATGAMWVEKNGRLVAAVDQMAVQTTNSRMWRRCKQAMEHEGECPSASVDDEGGVRISWIA
jgi:hypothetical protein